MPQEFDLNKLLSSIEGRQNAFNIRRRSMSGSLFVIDMANYAKFLKDVIDSASEPTNSFRDFINLALVKSPNWQSCVKECDQFKDMLTILGIWNNEPCRATYDIIPLDGSSPRPLNVENEDDLQEIILAAQLSRIICRKLELDGYRALQSTINKLRFESAESTLNFVKQAGQVLLTLRWRLSWWEVHGDGLNEKDPFRLQYVERIKSLTMILYFYFFTVKRKVHSWSMPEGIEGTWSNYADTLPMWDDLPMEESLQGLERWLEKGKQLVKDAGGKSKMPQFRR